MDLGCGTGRHLIYLAERDFEVYGFDESITGLKIAKNWLKDKKLTAQLKSGNLHKKFPDRDDFFDAIISTQVIQHGTTTQVKWTIAEITRVLKPGGIIFIIVPKKLTKNDLKNYKIKLPCKSKKIEPHVYVPTEGPEEGLPYFLFDKKLIKKFFHDFKIGNIHLLNQHYCFIGIKINDFC